MTDFNLPDVDTNYTDVLTDLKERDVSGATMDYTGDTNLPTDTVRLNRTNRVFETWNGSAWVEIYVEQPGIIKEYGGASAPRGHLICDGSAVSRTLYSDLFGVIGTSYGTGDGSTTFNLPDFRGRMPLGKATSGTGSTLGASGGSLDHSHSVPAHYHSMGTGADLNITSSGTHTTTIDISHSHTATSSSATTGVTATTETSTVSLNDPGHNHGVPTRANVTAFSSGSGNYAIHEGNLGWGGAYLLGSQSASSGVSLTNGAHWHAVFISDSGHSHTITVNALGTTNKTDTSGVHTHAAGNFSGKIGLVTGGVDGNAAMTSGTANPPFLVCNFIITI